VKDLNHLINDALKRKAVIEDCVALIQAEVKSKSGLTGMAVKTAFAIVTAIKPTILEESVDGLLDEFVAAAQPFYTSFQEAGEPGTLEQFLSNQRSAVAEGLLTITDKRAERSRHTTLVKAYQKLRPKGKVHVEEAVPGIGRLLDKHVKAL